MQSISISLYYLLHDPKVITECIRTATWRSEGMASRTRESWNVSMNRRVRTRGCLKSGKRDLACSSETAG